MKRVIQCLLTGLLLWTSVQGNAQSHQEYYQILQQWMQDMKKVQFPAPGQYYLMHLRMKMVPRNKYLENKETEVKMIAGANQLVYETDQVSIYQDRRNLYQVFHPQKLILHK
ncbi:hypothetical protein, partial [Microscilla marina]